VGRNLPTFFVLYINVITFYKKMSETIQKLLDAVDAWKDEDDKFVAGNNAAGTRARKALQEVAKAIKERRTEITEEKNARKEAKSAS